MMLKMLLYYNFFNLRYYSLNNNAYYQAKILLKLAANNKSNKIYAILNNINGSTTFKGDVFEYFLAELYKKIGWDTKIVGGKDDKGVDILLFNSKQKVYAIIQAKNTKRPLPKKEIANECDNFIGIYNSLGAAQKYTCNTLIIFSLNGYTKGAWDYDYPATHKIYRYEWTYIENLIKTYSNSTPKFKKSVKKPKIVAIIILVFIAYLQIYPLNNFPTTLTSDMIIKLNRTSLSSSVLTSDMIIKLNRTSLSSPVKQDCNRLNYSSKNCRKQLVYKYTKIYGSLQKGLIAYFCGPTNFKNETCGSYGEKMANYITIGQKFPL